MPVDTAVLHRIQALGLVNPVRVREAEAAVAALPVAGRPSAAAWLARAGHVRESTVAAIRDELSHPPPWYAQPPGAEDIATLAQEDGSEVPTQRRSATAAETPPPAPFARYPLPHWSRFEPVAFLGEGGMGKVFKAFDPTLRRVVALKFLHFGTRPGALEATLEEARAQAKLDHPHVVRLLEAGEIEGLAFLVLAHVDGVSLKALRTPLGLRATVALFEGVAEGVHAIHRLGIVHRDLKPANILVRRRDPGHYEALVTDFGVARDLRHPDDEGPRVVGTPLYMSPEQARGDLRVDRRSDIYSLGASLYQALLGVPPIPGSAGPDLLARVVREAPVPPRSLAPDFPEDLEAILLKCLAKDPEARYGSALDLASDLERFLSGRPVAARSADLAHRVGLWMRRNRLLAAALAGMVLVGGISGLVALKAWSDRRAAVVLAQRWSAEVAELEAARRQIHMLPTRDAAPDLAHLAERHKGLAAAVAAAPVAARGAGHFTLARAAMAFQHWEEAAAHLDRAAAAGYSSAEADLARGEVDARRYLAALAEVDRLPGPELRVRRLKELEARLLEPALRHLRAAVAAGAASSLTGALLAVLEKAPEAAVARAAAAFQAEPWRYEAKLLEARILLNEARTRRVAGGYREALAVLDRAGQAARLAAEVGRSDPEAWLALAERWELAALMGRHLGERRYEALDEAETACRSALACRPEHPPAIALLGRLGYQRADMGAERSDPGPAFTAAAALMEASLKADPGRATTIGDLAELHVSWGLRRAERGEDPGPVLRAAIEAGQRGLAQWPTDPRLMNLVALASLHGGSWALAAGGDPGPALARAEALLQAIEALDPSIPFAQNNLGWTHQERARQALYRGEDPGPQAELARRHLLASIRLNPNSAHSRQLLGEVAALRARWALDHGEDPSAGLADARRDLLEAERINPIFPATRISRVRVEAARAEAFARQGRAADQARALADLEAALAALDRVAPQRLEGRLERGRLLALRALLGRGPKAPARAMLASLLARQPANPEALALLKRLDDSPLANSK